MIRPLHDAIYNSIDMQLSISESGNGIFDFYRKEPCDIVVSKDFSISLNEIFFEAAPKTEIFNFELQAEYARIKESDPLILSSCPAKTVIDYYATRMQIEEGFRDIKNIRYGLALRFTGTRTTQRLKVLMLIAHIVTIIFYLIGLAAENQKMHLKMQSSSLKSRRVLSHVYLGSLLIQCGQYKLIQLREIKRAIQSIIRVIEHHDFA